VVTYAGLSWRHCQMFSPR